MSLVLACFARDLGQDVAGVDLVAVLDLEVGPRGQVVLLQDERRLLAVLVLGLLVEVDDLDPRLQLLVLGLDDDLAHQPGDLVLDLFHRHLADDVVELDAARLLGQDEGVERIPFGEDLAGLDLLAVLAAGSWPRRGPGSARPRGRGNP